MTHSLPRHARIATGNAQQSAQGLHGAHRHAKPPANLLLLCSHVAAACRQNSACCHPSTHPQLQNARSFIKQHHTAAARRYWPNALSRASAAAASLARMSSLPGAGAAALLDAAAPPTFWPVPVLADALSFSLQQGCMHASAAEQRQRRSSKGWMSRERT
jgi:hypothetical protein